MNVSKIALVFLIGTTALFTISCKKKSVPVPTVLTNISITNITSTSANCGGEVTLTGGSDVTVRGVCWGTNQNPTITGNKTNDGVGTGAFSSLVTGLSPVTPYYLRAYSTNSSGTSYGSQINFTTAEGAQPGPLTDADGNIYHTITIGTQVWSVENLKTTKYRNGDPIQNITDNTLWTNLVTGSHSWLNNDIANKDAFGALYNYYVIADIRNIAPKGWHVASDKDWTVLTNYLGGEYIAGGKLKETGTLHWLTPNVDATNETGFTALPVGYRHLNGSFYFYGIEGFWWTSTANPVDNGGWYRIIDRGIGRIARMADLNTSGFSARCIKD